MSDAPDVSERRPRKSSPIKPVLVVTFLLVAAAGGYYVFRMEQATELAGAARDQIQEVVLQTPLGAALGDAGILSRPTPKPETPSSTATGPATTSSTTPADAGQSRANTNNPLSAEPTPTVPADAQSPSPESPADTPPNPTLSGEPTALPGTVASAQPSPLPGTPTPPATPVNPLASPLSITTGTTGANGSASGVLSPSTASPDANLPVVVLPPLSPQNEKPGSSTSTSVTAANKNGGLVIQPREGVAPMVLYTEPVPGAKSPQELAEEQASGRIEKALIESSQTLTLSTADQVEVPGMSSPLSDDVPTDSTSVGRQDDAVVTPAFLSDLARLLVSSYKPATDTSNLSLKSVNLRYGTNLIGLKSLASSSSRARQSVLAYVYSPPMLEALYGMYVDSFLLSMVEATEQPGKNALTSSQSAKMFAYYGRQFQSLASTLRAMAATPNLPRLGQNFQNAEDALNKARARFAELGLAYDKARDARKPVDALAKQMQEASIASRQAADKAETAKVELLGGIRANAEAKSGLSDADTLYLASWILRRAQGPSADMFHESLAVSAVLFSDLAARCQEYSHLNQDS